MTVPTSFIIFLSVCACAIATHLASAAEGETPSPQQLEFFEKEVRPLLSKHCYECHSVDSKRVEAKLWLDSRDGHLRGGDSGEAIVPGDAEDSLLIEAVRYESYEMPPKGQLPEEDIDTFVRWVNMGAPWPEEDAPSAEGESEGFDLGQRKSEFWLWQPVVEEAAPEVSDQGWPRNDIDRYILSRLEEAELAPSRDADRTAILRRLYFDLIGLPPTAEEVAAFEADTEEGAIERVVDKLLASPHFGERWGRHWLDLVRYAESRGHEFDTDTPNAFQYRDYVIRALNADVPYDQFVREHIAGDLLPKPRLHPEKKYNESVLGTGFWFMGEWVHSPVDVRKDEADRFDNMLDVMSKTFLGVTVACARCHDHKFDAISTADYYSLSGFLQSSDYRQVRFESLEQNRQIAKQLAKVDGKFQRQLLKLLEKNDVLPPEAIHVNDKAVVVDYANIRKSDYLQDGVIFGQAPRRAGMTYLDSKSGSAKVATFGAAVNDSVWFGLESITGGEMQNRNKLGKIPKSGRTLRSPTFEVKHGNVSCLVEGAGHVIACVDSHRLVAGPLHGETIVAVKDGKRWVDLNLARYIGHRLHLEFVPAANQQMSVRMVTQGLNGEQRKDIDEQLEREQKQYEEYAQAAEAILGNTDAAGAKKIIRNWTRQRKRLASRIVRKSHIAPAMMDGTGEDDHILVRGNSSKPGSIEPRHFLTAISGDSPMEISGGSGRLELAEHINDPSNPLSTRVVVNRIWHHLMGRGIVKTVDDFGVLGQRPSHPKLLDHLATQFLSDGRSVKSMIKYIVLSRTYQMSSHADADAMIADPTNQLWHHRPPRRLQGEAIRDSLLALSDRLDAEVFGPPVPIHLTTFMQGRGRPGKSGPLDGDGRRSIYVAVRRNFLSPFMLTFDTPAPFSSMGKRNVSNVPAQALILLNDPLVVELARDWGKRALESISDHEGDAKAERITWMYVSGFGRRPAKQELDAATAFVETQASKRETTTEDPDIWASFAHALVNTKEFIFLR